MNLWIWFRSGETILIEDCEYYDAKQMDGFVRIKKNGSGTLICVNDADIRMIGPEEAIFLEGWEKQKKK